MKVRREYTSTCISVPHVGYIWLSAPPSRSRLNGSTAHGHRFSRRNCAGTLWLGLDPSSAFPPSDYISENSQSTSLAHFRIPCAPCM
ncbi:uncharacterized protein FOMMEDRAFT_20000 [Fomitiporia mediterranea MF3/22]|uniref:uncharacterized protein n=1 Tax=Fomitiporia mediterranea (strain MF3/22) TaxID=694068 RepID=UPI0004408AB1|nr:uncharacterized protein FOMMEDRAFT_20000 [Fomitiporia mediterranea MF3/22]EJD02736.1 hypothetical protein FOMMEDRAFT_20000 [Fomitiporia mediterranea MF3/22]